MSETLPNDADWEVPTHDAAVYSARGHKYALVIPVINEGERIRGQLSRIKAADLPVDVIVADGGSTDGSLDAEFVKPVGVRAVLTKTGPGKLSAQLRMAYAWCLREGYDGIVTIDGNGKDGVEAVAQFVAKLEEGCDYVQGSRYLRTGEAENTPLERTIANRLIHAPLLSLAGRHWFTDTTNGFRAYSARYLTHRDVMPFRGEFEVYNLLFYLTVRAGQLGLKVGHVPVVRRYPDDGKVPTKIGGFGPKLALLGETIVAATGGYTPDRAPRKVPWFGWPALICAMLLLSLMLSVVAAPQYTPDSWALYELSTSVFGDFYRFHHFRSYAGETDYSSAFAPLYPSLIAVVDGVLGTGARTGLYLAFASFFGFALVSERIGRKITGTGGIGTAIALLLLLGPGMVWGELVGGRTIPLQLLLYSAVLLWLLPGRAITPSRAAMIGFVCGIAVMNRFDAAFLPVLAAFMILAFTRSPRAAIASLCASIIAVSPWIVYSVNTFGTLFASDNSGIATALDPRAFVTDWWPQAQPGMVDDPLVWLGKIAGFAGQWLVNGLSIMLSPLGFAIVFALAVLGAVQVLAAKAPIALKPTRIAPEMRAALWLFTGACALMMAPQVLTGYLEYRYYSALVWAGILAIYLWQINRGQSSAQRQVYATIVAGVIGLWVAGFAMHQWSQEHGEARANWADFDRPDDVAQLRACLGPNDHARILVMGDDVFAAKAGALGALRTMQEPRNMAQGRLAPNGEAQFLRQWDVEYLLLHDNARNGFPARTGFEPVADCPMMLFKKSN